MAKVTLSSLRQCRIRPSRHRECSRHVGEALGVEVAQARVRSACQRHVQLRGLPNAPHNAREALSFELSHMPPCFTGQRLEKHVFRLASVRKGPQCIGEILSLKLAYAPLSHSRQNLKQLRVRSSHHREGSYCI
eukprot:gnl/TRDRNA2_/TRDRNA2_155011_c2_seq5.p1 gnl/TRDRNA2_/TRDRNA2_155011_c2~~gnl/TRDRNA2_/TRDRNA2_155011_c2_seq5.p1  ORF type:complete len:134 (+),score=5.10 gnl/TRDRNA2_/TRDRNA2_155011_c2_seq5:213-614(+)